jgi:hypothetical protein
MRTYVRTPRPQRTPHVVRPLPRPVRRVPTIVRREQPVARPRVPPAPPVVEWTGFQAPDPYVDYGRWLTPEGGILIAYKDLDQRLRHTLWRIFAWTVSTGFETWFVLTHSPVQSQWINFGCLLLMGLVNGFIVWKAVEVYRTIEITPDAMILEGSDVFWLRMMENGLPEFKTNEEGHLVLSGIYGTRFVEYLTARRFDEYDRMPEVFAAHLQDAMRQLWATALSLGTVPRSTTRPTG